MVHASSVIVFLEQQSGASEILMTRRSTALSFAASAIVFPGDKVAEADLRLAQADAERAARIAAVRETLEEIGLVLCVENRISAEHAAEASAMLAANEDLATVLAHFSWSLDTDQLLPFSRWLPNFKPGRIFDTRFYLANIGTGAVDLEPDHGENTQLFWITAAAALDSIECGDLKAIYPTRRNLERLAQFGSFNSVIAHLRTVPTATISPWIENGDDGEILCIPDGLGYPVTRAPLSQISIA